MMLKVLQVANTLAVSDGGPARNSTDLNIALNELPEVSAQLIWVHGDEAESVLRSRPAHAPALPDPGPQRVRISGRGSRAWTPWRSLAQLVRSDVVVLHGYYLAWVPVVAAACLLTRRPYVITPHGSLTRHQRKASRGRKRVFETAVGWWLRAGAAGFVVGSEMEAAELAEAFPSSRAGVGGVGTFPPAHWKAEQAPQEPLRLITLSRISPKKRIDLCIEAVRALVDSGADVRLRVAGTGPVELVAELRELARREAVSDQVEFVGELRGDAKTDALLAADIFLMPSDDENFGIGLAEATAHGLPVVTSNGVAAARALLPDAGVVLNPPSAAGIATAVRHLSEPARFRRAQAAARASAEASFSWTSAALDWERHLRRVAERELL